MSETRIPLRVVENEEAVALDADSGVIRAVSPTVDLERVTDPNPGVKITVKDVRGTHSETVLDGEGGGGDIIDDTTPAADKVFSSSKVNTELNTVKSALQELISVSETSEVPTITTTEGYIKADGTQETGTGYAFTCSDYIDISTAKEHKASVRSTIYGVAGTAWYNKNKEVIGYITGANASDYSLESSADPQSYNITLPADAAYIRLSSYRANVTPENDLYISFTSVTKESGEFLQSQIDAVEADVKAVDDKVVELTGEEGHEVIPELTIVDGKFIYQGSAVGSQEWECSDYVDIGDSNGHQVTCISTVNGVAETAWYDSSKALIGVVNGNNASEYGITAADNYQQYIITLPSNAKYIRISGHKTTKQTGDALKVTYQTAPIEGEIDTKLATKASKTDVDVLKSIVGDPEYMNLVDTTKFADNSYIDGSTGIKTASSYYKSSDFLLLKANTLYYVGNFYIGQNTAYQAFYSAPNEDSFISNPDVTLTRDSSDHCTVLVGSSDVYVRFSALKASTNIYVSSHVDYYVEYTGPITLKQMVTPKCRFKKILVLGDSITTDYYGNYKKWVTDLIDEGFFPEDVNNNSQHATGFVARYDNQPNDFISRLTAVQNPETYDLVIVFGGVNDAIKLIPMGTDSDTDYTTYLNPAVKYFYKYLCTNFINARIGVCLPLPCSTQNREASVIGVLYQYSEFYKKVAESYSLPVLDLTNHSGFYPDANKDNIIDYDAAQAFRNRWTLVVGQYAADGIHPTEEYEKKFLAPMIKKFIESL